ncbi:hypothetical protein ANTHELSMS3_03894 [Antarctobacter heliothermus]|uniref:Uncharacterized protein n=1 Tax=Antarctobacter heliothermus TaxID=74033 RepID=A0A222E8K8_9RHOB|nr:hypothetical protein ANTHELSMS3_03894 [Antarctobacter heliothermus]
MKRPQSCGPNPIKPDHLMPQESRAALCKVLALGLIRLRMLGVARCLT